MKERPTTTFRYVETEKYVVGVPRSGAMKALTITDSVDASGASSSRGREGDLLPVALRLHGGVYDVGRSAELNGELDSILPHCDVVLDLGLTEYFDCSSIGVLIAKLKAWNQEKPGTRIRLRNVNRQLAGAFIVLGLEHVFVVERSAVSHHGAAAS